MTDHSEARVTVWMSEDLTDDIDAHVNWRYSSRSEWVREAVQLRLALEKSLDRRNIELPDDEDERKELLDDIATAGVATFATPTE